MNMSPNPWRTLALQFDGHRIQAIGHLSLMVKNPVAHKEQAEIFLSAPPLQGDKELAHRIASILPLTHELISKGGGDIDDGGCIFIQDLDMLNRIIALAISKI